MACPSWARADSAYNPDTFRKFRLTTYDVVGQNKLPISGQGYLGLTARKDMTGRDKIASQIGAWIRNKPGLKGIIRKWLIINLDSRNNFAVGFDKNGYCWRTRRKNTPGWKVEERLTTQHGARYVIEKRRII